MNGKFQAKHSGLVGTVYKEEPAEKRSEEKRCAMCEDLSRRAGLHKPAACSPLVHVHVRVHVLPSRAPKVSSVLLPGLQGDNWGFSVHVDTPQLQNHSPFKRVLKAKILMRCPVRCPLAAATSDSAFRQGCGTDNLVAASFSLDAAMLCLGTPSKSNTYGKLSRG